MLRLLDDNGHLIVLLLLYAVLLHLLQAWRAHHYGALRLDVLIGKTAGDEGGRGGGVVRFLGLDKVRELLGVGEVV